MSERIPEQTLSGITGPAKRYEIPWYELPKLADLGPALGRSETWISIYGRDAERGERALRVVHGGETA